MPPISTLIILGAPDKLVSEATAHLHGWEVLNSSDDWQFQKAMGTTYAFIPWILPNMAGVEACRRLRALAPPDSVHITMLIDSDSKEERLQAIRAGADDYMLASSFSLSEVIARVTRIFPNSPTPIERRMLSRGDLFVDQDGFRVRYLEQEISLTRGQFALLLNFLKQPNRVVSRATLEAQLGKQGITNRQTIDRGISRLRKKLKSSGMPDPIRTIYRVGYVFDLN
ncbi:MAG: phosphate regulon transcriptional regulator PhoB [Burkholderiaceae bacterium]